MGMFAVIGGIGFALAFAIAVVVVRAARQREETRAPAEREAQRQAEEASQREETRAAAEREAQYAVASPPSRYRPPARIPPGERTVASPEGELESRDRAIAIEVRLVFEKAGFCRVSLLPRHASGMPLELAVTGSGNPPELLALRDEDKWYQDVVLPDIGCLLSVGIEWAGALPDGRSAKLSLAGRDLYVLAKHSELNGYVSAPRLILGDEHVVLCVAASLPEVRAAITMTGSPESALLNSDSGIPTGWVGLRGVLPNRPIAPSPEGDILDALKPLADVKIALNGGIRIDRQTWLNGFPPSIRLLGDTSTIGVITIDGQDAKLTQGGSYIVPGWDSCGEHSVWCTSASRTYAIHGGAEEWEPWDAYNWSLGEPRVGGARLHPAICGVLVRPPRVARPDSHSTVVAASNPILIGARPGKIEVCTARGDVRAGLCVGFPSFEPVWAIPADPFHCDKRTARVLLIGSPEPVQAGDHKPKPRDGRRGPRHRPPASESHAWCAAILAAGGKGLRTEPSRADIADLWNAYKRYARALRKGWR